MENLILSPISIGELRTVISETVANEIKKLISLKHQPEHPEHPEHPELITRRLTANLLGISLVTLNEWTKSGIIPAHRISTRVRYKRAEVLGALTQIQTKSIKEAA